MKLGLGTVQFGLPYGIAGKGAATAQDEIERILGAAEEAGIDCLDTAPLYGDSEERLGLALQGRTSFRIVTKTPAFASAQLGGADAEALRSTFMRSLDRLRQPRVYGLLIHHAEDLLKPGGIALADAMRTLADEKLVEKIGVSVYTASELDRVLEVFEPDLVQLPLSVLDQRFVLSGHLGLLRRRHVEVHARSIFLQGLLLMDRGALPRFFAPLDTTLRDYASALDARRMTRMHGALAFMRQMDAVDYAIVGVQDAQELGALLEAMHKPLDAPLDFARFAVANEDMILPPRWKL